MSVARQLFGQRSEARASRHLKRLGYRILARNVRTPLGEIDIIAREGDDIVFVEVKARNSLLYGHPQEAVTRRKQMALSRAALFWLKGEGLMGVPARFDVVAMVVTGKTHDIEVIRNAFPLALP
ncbi:MAG: YraN family protein [Desulfobacterales bacterium]|nr:YraN family protein [Desulfobacterales bacterium]